MKILNTFFQIYTGTLRILFPEWVDKYGYSSFLLAIVILLLLALLILRVCFLQEKRGLGFSKTRLFFKSIAHAVFYTLGLFFVGGLVTFSAFLG